MLRGRMPIRSRVHVLLAEHNLARANANQSPISVREVARATGITHSALVKIMHNRSGRIDFATIDKLMQYFGTTNVADILEYVPPTGGNNDTTNKQ